MIPFIHRALQYRNAAPASCDDNKLRALIKEHGTEEKIQVAIQALWDSSEVPVPVEPEWSTTSRQKKSSSQTEGTGASDRNAGAGRGKPRTAPAGGRGSGSRVDNRPSAPRANSEATAPAVTPVSTATIESAAPAAASAVKGSDWGKKNAPKGNRETRPVAAAIAPTTSGSKTLPEPVQTTAWGASFGLSKGETMADKLKRIEQEKKLAEEEKNKPPAPPTVVEEPPAAAANTEKTQKQRKPKTTTKKGEKAPVTVPANEPSVITESVAEAESAQFQNLSISTAAAVTEPEVPASPPRVKSTPSVDVQSSPKIGLTMGKYNSAGDNKGLSAMEIPQFGSFGNATTSLIAEEPPAASTAWGATTGDSSTSDVPVWSNGQQTDSSNSAGNTSQSGPPGLVSKQRSAPGQSRGKGENQQSGQQAQAYQQSSAFGASGSRGAPMSMMYGAQPSSFDNAYMPQQFQPAPTATTGAASTSAGANLSAGTASMPQQAQPTYPQAAGMAPQFYGQNPYYYPQGGYYYQPPPPQYNYGQPQRGYQNRPGMHHYEQYAHNGYGDGFGQFGAAAATHGSKPSKDGAQDQSAGQQTHQQMQQQAYPPQYMNYPGNPGSFNQGGYAMPYFNPAAAPQGGGGGGNSGRDSQRGNYQNYGGRNAGGDANTQQSGYPRAW